MSRLAFRILTLRGAAILLIMVGGIVTFQNCGKTIKHVDEPSATYHDGDLLGLMNPPELTLITSAPALTRVTVHGYAVEPLNPNYKVAVRLEVLNGDNQSVLCTQEERADLESADEPEHGYQISCDYTGQPSTLSVALLGRAAGEPDFKLLDSREVTGGP